MIKEKMLSNNPQGDCLRPIKEPAKMTHLIRQLPLSNKFKRLFHIDLLSRSPWRNTFSISS